MQEIVENGTTVFLADAGMMLTDGSSFGTTARLGNCDDGAKWREITEEEAEAIQREQAKMRAEVTAKWLMYYK